MLTSEFNASKNCFTVIDFEKVHHINGQWHLFFFFGDTRLLELDSSDCDGTGLTVGGSYFDLARKCKHKLNIYCSLFEVPTFHDNKLILFFEKCRQRITGKYSLA